MNKSEICAFLETLQKNSKIKLNKSPILLDIEIKTLDEYNLVSDDILLERHNFISNNQDSKIRFYPVTMILYR